MLVHCVSLESEHPLEDYQVVRDEINRFESGVLAEKPEIILLTKSDTRTPEEIKKIAKIFSEMGKEVHTVSVLDDAAVKALADTLSAKL